MEEKANQVRAKKIKLEHQLRLAKEQLEVQRIELEIGRLHSQITRTQLQLAKALTHKDRVVAEILTECGWKPDEGKIELMSGSIVPVQPKQEKKEKKEELLQ